MLIIAILTDAMGYGILDNLGTRCITDCIESRARSAILWNTVCFKSTLELQMQQKELQYPQ